MFYQVFSDGDITQGPLLNVIYAAAVVAIMFVSCILYTKRKSEMAQSASTKNPLYQFILLAASVGGGALFGFGYQGIFGWGIESMMVVIFTSCIFTVAIYLVFNAIVSRNPKQTYKPGPCWAGCKPCGYSSISPLCGKRLLRIRKTYPCNGGYTVCFHQLCR